MCGIVGIFGTENITTQLYNGLRHLQHRGQSSAGFITYDGNIYAKKDSGFVGNLMWGYRGEDQLAQDHPGPIGIAHTRYSTFGGDTKEEMRRNAQPEYLINPFIAVCFNGNIYNGNEVMPTVYRKPRTTCDIQYLLLPMAQELPSFPKINFDTIVEAGEHVLNLAKGSYSALYLTAGRDNPYLIGMTDPHKIRPMVVGRKEDTWYIASESCVLKRLGVKDFQDVDSGTIVSVNPDSDKPDMKKVVKRKKYICMFEYIYFADPASWIEGRSVHQVRTKIGQELGEKTAPKADIVVPVPESGRRYAIGFSLGSGIPIEEGIKKDKAHRVFILQTQDQREKKVKDNLEAIDAALDGKNVVLTDDSLVRGTNIKRVIAKVREAGAKKVHVRIGCPPLVAPCYLGIDMRSKREFIAIDQKTNEHRSDEKIAELIGADSLAYGGLDTLRRAIGFDDDECGLCTGCINYPKGVPAEMREDITHLYETDRDSSCRAYEMKG